MFGEWIRLCGDLPRGDAVFHIQWELLRLRGLIHLGDGVVVLFLPDRGNFGFQLLVPRLTTWQRGGARVPDAVTVRLSQWAFGLTYREGNVTVHVIDTVFEHEFSSASGGAHVRCKAAIWRRADVNAELTIIDLSSP